MRAANCTYTARWATPEELGESFADSDHRRLEIRIGSDLSDELAENSVVHEQLEAENYHNEWLIPHQLLCAIEVAVTRNLRDSGIDLSPLLDELGDRP